MAHGGLLAYKVNFRLVPICVGQPSQHKIKSTEWCKIMKNGNPNLVLEVSLGYAPVWAPLHATPSSEFYTT